MDDLDRKILEILQTNATLPLSEISKRVGISKTPCWNRIRAMEEKRIIKGRITLLDREKIGLPLVMFLAISVGCHSREWTQNFIQVIQEHDEIIEVHRITGSESDYMLKVVASSIREYDKFQQMLIGKLEFTKMSSSVSLQELKCSFSMPLAL
tara:strand:- start:480 stop:938 length:459 start_codon:yes stop_codon:yes gene_type:complete